MPTPSNFLPKRIQRSRKAGSKLPANTKCVTRGTPFGNPFKVAKNKEELKQAGFVADVETAVGLFEGLVIHDSHLRKLIVTELRGFNLACWCKPGDICHADVLLRIANG